MHSGGAYVELCIDGLVERLQNAEEQALEEREARTKAEQQLEEKSIEIQRLSEEFSDLIRSLETQILHLKQEKDDLIHLEKSATKNNKVNSSLLTVMGHELKAPLVGMTNMVQLLDSTPLNKTQTSYLRTLQSSSQALGEMIGEMLDLARLEEGIFELDEQRFNLHALLAETVEAFSQQATEKRLELLYLYDNKVPRYISGDAHRIRQVLANLLSNAIKYTDRGEIMLLMSGIEIDDQSLMLLGEVEDSGTGLSDESLARLFNSPKPSVGASQSTRLGLPLTKRLLEHMGGSITVNSQVDIGSRFLFSFKAGTAEQDHSNLDDTQHFRDKSVLLVIDNAKSRDVLEATLKKWYMRTHCLESVREAFMYLNDPENPCDLMILDIEEQLFDSALIAKPIKQIRASLPLILLRGPGNTDDGEHIALFNACLPKPVNPEQLLYTMSTAL